MTRLLAFPEQVTKALKRGTVRSDDEFYAVRERLDEIEGKPEFRAEIAALYSIIDQYESR